ncbi:MAG: exodeoxyribonuclease VII large subunit [Bryobacteraceae bacterium]|nr:exodeoxyribonuclease VII large subunit [Bryobacteraceae bacterium]
MQIPLLFGAERRQFTVSQLTDAIKAALNEEFTDIWVAGEVSGTKAAASGHIYFTLKDREAQIRCACFARTARFLRFRPQDGIQVVVRGRIDVYAPRGEYQLLVDALEPRGFGALQAAFEELKKKLAAEGLFDTQRKRPIPAYPRRIGIVTSPSGAVIQDMLKILTRRFPGLHIRLYPAQVQGEGSVEQLVRGIDYFSRTAWPDVVILARGGGSVEDLWSFNEEAVARAVAGCSVPVVCAVGHETDFTIADFVADLRAPTPSAAAELVVGTRQQIVERLEGLNAHLRQAVRYRLAMAQRRSRELGVERLGGDLHRMIGKRMQRVDELEGRGREVVRGALEGRKRRLAALESRLARMDVRLRLAEGKRRLEAAVAQLEQRMRWLMAAARRRLDPLGAHLHQLSPLRILDRGYALVQKPDGELIKDAGQVRVKQELRVRLAKGELDVRVARKRE